MINPFNKLSTLLLAILTASSTLLAAQMPCKELPQETVIECVSKPLIELKTGYFFFSSSTMHKIYDKGGLDVRLCASYPLWNLACRWNLNVYGALEYFQKSGKSINGNQKTSLWSIPLSFGLKPIYAINANMDYYIATGPRFIYMHQQNNSSFIYKNKSKNSIGFFVNTGINYVLCERLKIDIFGEYSYASIRFHSGKSNVYTKSMHIGGFTLGGGFGYEF